MKIGTDGILFEGTNKKSQLFFIPFLYLEILEKLVRAGHLDVSDIKDSSVAGEGTLRDALKKHNTRLGTNSLSQIAAPARLCVERIISSMAPNNRKSVVLLIDEINRADLSRVFGDTMTALEANKRAGMPEARAVRLPYSSGEQFFIPRELSIIGTMNAADRSIASIDLALRRRFEFEEVKPTPTLCPENYGEVNVRAFLDTVNKRIAAVRSEDYLLGHSDFMKQCLESVRKRHFAGVGIDDAKVRALAIIVQSKVLPALEQVFGGDLELIRDVLGGAPCQSVRFPH